MKYIFNLLTVDDLVAYPSRSPANHRLALSVGSDVIDLVEPGSGYVWY